MQELRRMDESEIRQLYSRSLVRDFPADELKSLSAILSLYHRGEYDVLGAYESEAMVAYALVFRPTDDSVALLDYLAVEPEYRSRGVGSELLGNLRIHYAATAEALMIECERPQTAPDQSQARKRIEFYTRAGAVLTEVCIWLFGVEYSILFIPCGHSTPAFDCAKRMLGLYRQMLPEELYVSNVKLIK